MPNRIIKESALTSRDLDQLTDGAERLFFRLTVVADDMGRLDADPRVVLAKCFPLRIDRLKPVTIAKWMQELVDAGLVKIYTAEGRSYGFFISWTKHQRCYGLKSKFPQPPADCGNFPQPPGSSCSYPISDIRESRIENRDTRDETGQAVVSVEDIQKRWNELPGVKPLKAIGSTIRDRIRLRIKEHPDQAWWDALLARIRLSSFLCGRTNGNADPFHASLDWVLAPKNLDKINAGNFDCIASNGHKPSSTCTKRVQGDKFLRDCGQPASPDSPPNEPRCAQHFSSDPQPKEPIDDAH